MSVVAAYHIFVCGLFLVQGGMWTAVYIPPCTGNNAHTNTRYAATTLIIKDYS
jgi:hypothetical protein